MTPQEKANELVEKFKEHSQLMIGYGGFSSRNGSAKQCALICVDEILDIIKLMPYGMQYLIARDYFEEVKEEIQKL